jgi:hypothetical protein
LLKVVPAIVGPRVAQLTLRGGGVFSGVGVVMARRLLGRAASATFAAARLPRRQAEKQTRNDRSHHSHSRLPACIGRDFSSGGDQGAEAQAVRPLFGGRAVSRCRFAAPTRGRQTQRCTASRLSLGWVLKQILAPGTSACTRLIIFSNSSSCEWSARNPAPIKRSRIFCRQECPQARARRLPPARAHKLQRHSHVFAAVRSDRQCRIERGLATRNQNLQRRRMLDQCQLQARIYSRASASKRAVGSIGPKPLLAYPLH